jgi:hypothetical protein
VRGGARFLDLTQSLRSRERTKQTLNRNPLGSIDSSIQHDSIIRSLLVPQVLVEPVSDQGEVLGQVRPAVPVAHH